jgi:hypothetical protein
MTLTSLTKVAIAKEGSFGGTSSVHNLIPVQPPSFSTTYEGIKDEGLRGVAAKDFGMFQGSGEGELSLEGLFHPDVCGYLLFGIMGSVSVNGSVSTFSLGAEPPSFKITDETKPGTPGATAEANVPQYTGCLMNNLTMKFNAGEGAMSYTAGFKSKPAGTVAALGTAIIGTPTTPLLGWMGSVDVGGAAFVKLIDAEINISREVVLGHAAVNSKSPSFGYVGPMEVTIKATVELQAMTDWTRNIDASDTPIVLTLSNAGAGTALRKVVLTAPNASFLEGPVEADRGAANMRATWNMRPYYTAAQAGSAPIIIALTSDATTWN